MGTDHCQFVYDNMIEVSKPSTGLTLLWKMKRLIWHTALLRPLKFLSEKTGTVEPWYSMTKRAWRFGVFGPSDCLSSVLLRNQEGKNLGGTSQRQNRDLRERSKLSLSPGDWVEVRSFEEIYSTLNEEGKLHGLVFMKEMKQYCGQRFKVFKKLEKIVLETTGELRRIRSSTVLLEGVFCTGEAHGNCDRSCFCFWREDWLKQVSGPKSETTNRKD